MRHAPRFLFLLAWVLTPTWTLPAQDVGTIAVSPVTTPDGIPDSVFTRYTFDTLLSGELQRAGFKVVPAGETDRIFRRLVDSVGGYYDRMTGDLIESKYRAVRLGSLADLRVSFGAAWWVEPQVVVLKADFERGRAHWDGAAENVSGRGGTGSVPAASLHALVLGVDGDTLYAGQSGIQVLVKEKKGELVWVEREKFFTDAKRNAMAVRSLVDSILVKLGKRRSS